MSSPTRTLTPRSARALLLGLGAFCALCILDPGSPPPAGLDAAPARFSAGRARAALEQIAREPHPTGSPAQERVRRFLEQRFEELGLAWERQPWEVLHPGAPISGVNLLVRLPAAGGDPAARSVLCVTHYDSHPAAPGAGDDGAAVAAALECLRALALDGPRRNERVFLFTDGEEFGLLGALQFAADPARTANTGVVLNFEARGNSGPVILFETGPHDRAWVSAYAACVPAPLGSSLGPAVYERMPNDTDFTVFKDLGLPGLNFAFVGGGTAYHRPADSLENLDERALQQHGETLLALARHLGDVDLDELAAQRGRATFFTLPGNLFVHYPAPWDLAVLVLAALSVAGTLAAGLRARRLAPSGLVLGLLAAPCVSALVAFAIAALALGVRAGVLALAPAGVACGNGSSSTWFLAGLTSATLCTGAWLSRWLEPRARDALAAGALTLWVGLGAAALACVPGAAHVFIWSALATALSLYAAWRLQTRSDWRASAHLALWGSSLGLLALGLPVAKLLHQVGAVSPAVGLGLGAAVLALGVGLGLPALALLTGPLSRRWSWGWSLLSLGLLACAAWVEAAGR